MSRTFLRGLVLFFTAVFLFSSLSGCRSIRKLFQKKKEPQKVEQKQPAPESAPAPAPPSSGEPGLPPPPPSGVMLPPGMMPPPGVMSPEGIPMPPGTPGTETMPKGPSAPPPFGQAPTEGPPGEQPPTPPPSPALPEVGGAINLSAGAGKNVAEGSYFLIEDAQAASPAGKSLSYQWSVTQGPPDKIKVLKGNVLQGAFKVLDVSQPTKFVLRLTASDGASQTSSDVNVTAYPVRLEFKNHLGGITRQVQRIGDLTYVSRGRTLEIYDPLWVLLGKEDLTNPILEMAGFTFQQKNYLYVLTEAGEWLLLDVTDPKAIGKSLVQKGEAFLKDLRITVAGNEAWGTSLEGDAGTLWSISDLARPQVKLSLKGPYKNLKKMVLWGKNIYLADQESVYTVEAVGGVLRASIPAGGVVTGLEVVSVGSKSFLVAALGQGGKEGKKSDAGLRVFEIGVGGKLTNERRFHLKGDPTVERITILAGTNKLLLGVKQNNDLSLRIFDLGSEGEIPLDLPATLRLAGLLDLATGLMKDAPFAVIADASALRVLKLNPAGNPLSRYKADVIKTSYSTLAAGAVKMAPGGASVFLLDFGSRTSPLVPALQEIGSADLSTKGTLVLGDGSYFSDFVLTDRPKFNFATNLNDSASPLAETAPSRPATLPATLPSEIPSAPGRGVNDGTLRLFSTELSPFKSFVSSARLFGEKKDPNESRALGMDGWLNGNTLVLATAVGKVSGLGLRSGLTILRLPLDTDPALLLKGDLASKTTFIPLNDARDVKIAPGGKWALVAAGSDGLVVVDLEKNQVVLRSNPQPGTVADRVLLSHDQKRVYVSAFAASTLPGAEEEGNGISAVPSMVHVFYFNEGQLGVWGQIQGLSTLNLPYGLRCGETALSEDDLYFFVANGRKGLWVYNTSDPTSPTLISKLETFGNAAGVAVGQKYKNIYIADLINGLEMAEFGF